MTLINSKKSTLIIILIFIVIAVISFYGSRSLSQKKLNNRQAVFITNGQVYFGNVSKLDEQIVKLENVFYLPKDKTVQAGDKDNDKLSLIKLGTGPHAPEDVMFINRDHILFVENLKKDSKVSQAIDKFYANDGEISTDNTQAPSTE